VFVKRLIAGLVALPLATAVAAGPSACTSFGEENTPEAGASVTSFDGAAAESGSTDSGSTDSGPGSACRPACPACFVDSFDTLDGAWKPIFGGGNAVVVAAGQLRSSVPIGGNAYLERPLQVAARLYLSFEVRLDVAPSNGTSLAKIVDTVGNEINIQVDDGRVRPCAFAKTGAAVTPACGGAQDLPPQTPLRLTLEITFANGTAGGTVVKLAVGCASPALYPIPRDNHLRLDTKVNLHVGVEGRGVATYDDLDLSPPN